MSGTSTPTPTATTAATNDVIKVARDAPELLAGFQAANPALAAQLTGSLATYLKSGGAPLVGTAIGYLVAHYALGWSQGDIDLATEICCAIGAAVVSAANHWWSKAPARAMLAPEPAA